jgi:hypothetical protein
MRFKTQAQVYLPTSVFIAKAGSDSTPRQSVQSAKAKYGPMPKLVRYT